MGLFDKKTNLDSLSVEQQYGMWFLNLLNPSKRANAYAELEKLEGILPEAGIVVGQYYQASDIAKARVHFKVAADANIAEGYWGYANTFNHSYVPDLNQASDKTWIENCLSAAELGCADAQNEMGNMCNRNNCLAEAMYWYEMALTNEHPEGQYGVMGIAQKWKAAGSDTEYKKYTSLYTKERHQASILFLQLINQNAPNDFIDQMMRLMLNSTEIAGYILASLFEDSGNLQMAYKCYNALSFDNFPHALRCYSDMLVTGRGVDKDIPSAYRFYEQAALKGERAAMFVMGEKCRSEGDKYKAAYWYGQSYCRGYDMAATRLSQMTGK